MMTIAMDGPAGAGKSTAAKLAAQELGIHYVDTGAMYRAIAYGILKAAPAEEVLDDLVRGMDVRVEYIDNEQHVYVDGEDVMGVIRTPEVSAAASRYAALPVVREKLLGVQRTIAEEYDVVMDGRDIGTVVLPHAETKIFITADPAERARRRALELEMRTGEKQDVDAIEREIRERDYRDSHREIAPLKQADDAVLLDTTHMSIEEVVAEVCRLAREHHA
ncbi:MAG: (d)CMP kinase [Firmicutes bacterium]|nr:(d)CMP kinase [Bacillota bacterium]